MQELKHIVVVLENPQSSKNIGAVCRAMKNNGLTRLRIAGRTQIDFEAASITALHAADILDNVEFFDTVEDSVKGTVISAALSRRRGKKRKHISLYPEELAKRVLSIEEGDVAIVFGNEKSGLSDEDMSHCNIAVMIPTSEEFPSLNLSHAVQVTAYEIFKLLTVGDGNLWQKGYRPIDSEEMHNLTKGITDNLDDMGFFKRSKPELTGDFLRDIFARAALSAGEAQKMEDLFNKVRGLYLKKQ